jgi:hypothetical protein
VIGFDRLSEDFALPQKVILANKFIQGPRSHPISKGGFSLE